MGSPTEQFNPRFRELLKRQPRIAEWLELREHAEPGLLKLQGEMAKQIEAWFNQVQVGKPGTLDFDRLGEFIKQKTRLNCEAELLMKVTATASPRSDIKVGPPRGSTFLLACLTRRGRAEEVIGDAETEYRKMVDRLGLEGARWHYRKYVAEVVIEMLPGVLARVLLLHKLLGLLGL
jgi:hypothetical protein